MCTDLAACFSGERLVEISTQCEPFPLHNRRAGTTRIASCNQFEPRSECVKCEIGSPNAKASQVFVWRCACPSQEKRDRAISRRRYGDPSDAKRDTNRERLGKTTGDGYPERGIFRTRTGKLWADLSQNTCVLRLHDHREAQAGEGGRNAHLCRHDRKGAPG